jgi:hypothetical protein
MIQILDLDLLVNNTLESVNNYGKGTISCLYRNYYDTKTICLKILNKGNFDIKISSNGNIIIYKK